MPTNSRNRPRSTINQASGQVDPTSDSPINFTAIFTEPVSGFDGDDVSLGGTAGATTAVVTAARRPTTSLSADEPGRDGDRVDPGRWSDRRRWHGNFASTSTDDTVTFDVNDAPTATVTNGQCSTTNMASGTINLTLSDADGDTLTLVRVSNSNTTLLPNSKVVLGGSGSKPDPHGDW